LVYFGETVEDQTLCLWRFVRLDQYARAMDPAREAVREGILGLLDHLQKSEIASEAFLMRTGLASVPAYLMERVAAQPDWTVQTPALNQALGAWAREEQPASPIQVAIGAPHSGVSTALATWAKELGWRLVVAPTYEQILEGGGDWLKQFSHNQEKPLVIPKFEHLYLRHHAGLSLVRRLLDWLWSTKRRCLIGCDSWAWAYLTRALQIDTLVPHPITLAAFDYEHLRVWLQELASHSERFVFRQTDNGHIVLPPAVSAKSGETEEVADYLRHLAAFSRGIPGVAWATWRYSLQYGIDESVQAKAQETAEQDQHLTIWVKAWSQLNLPELPRPVTQPHLFVLHALLLHGGLTTKGLAQVLPLSATEVIESIHRLGPAGLIETAGDRYQVAAMSYPVVRKVLSQEGYLVDAI
jgi:hypothetical protein